ncbi:membrane protein [Gordonia phage LittleMunchkin]|nr:membrane protein [Gordonia phage LittleMunchkin]
MSGGELVLTLLGSAGFLTGIGGLLHFLNTRKPTKNKSSADAYAAYSTWVSGAMTQTTAELQKAVETRRKLIDLVQSLIAFARTKGATPHELDGFQDQLDDLRQL